MRSLLFVPGDSERKLAKAMASGADALLIDLEDSVPLSNKRAARDMAADFLRGAARTGGPALYVRINDLSTGLAEDDLDAVVAAAPDGVMLPKCNGSADLEQLGAMLRVAEAKAGIADESTRIVAIMMETPLGVLAAPSCRGPVPRLAGITWGAEDLSASLGASASRDESGRYTDVFRLARSLTLLTASVLDTAAIDTVFVNFRDPDGLARECAEAVRDGFTGKLAIHPDQVEVINRAFTPTPEALARAEAIVKAFADAGNPGVVGIDGKMYDRPHLRLAERLLSRAKR